MLRRPRIFVLVRRGVGEVARFARVYRHLSVSLHACHDVRIVAHFYDLGMRFVIIVGLGCDVLKHLDGTSKMC